MNTKELTKAEYLRLLSASKKNEQRNLVIQTICGTGIRVSELQYITVEAVRCGEITVSYKSKTRTILVPGKLKNISKKISPSWPTFWVTAVSTPPESIS